MTCGLVHASYSLPEWQAVKLPFLHPACACEKNLDYFFLVAQEQTLYTSGNAALLELSPVYG